MKKTANKSRKLKSIKIKKFKFPDFDVVCKDSIINFEANSRIGDYKARIAIISSTNSSVTFSAAVTVYWTPLAVGSYNYVKVPDFVLPFPLENHIEELRSWYYKTIESINNEFSRYIKLTFIDS